jgi:sterol desaturase/sphingolipid hydroxylase (fatty acid hydroxylase superfamily)
MEKPNLNIITNERAKYKSKGWGIIIAYLLMLMYFTYVLTVANNFYKTYYYEDIDKGKFIFWSVIIVHEVVFYTINAIFFLIYKFKVKCIESYRVNADPWPWEDNSINFPHLLQETIKTVLINQLIIIPISILPYYFNYIIPFSLDIKSLPTHFVFIWQIIFFILIEDFAFYWVHRILHVDWIYPYIHKTHHTYKISISIAAEYSHPVDYFLGSLFATSFGPIILGQKVHLVTYLLWIAFRILESSDGHCGYEFSFSPFRVLPFSGSSQFHYFHHKYYKGNYSSFFIYWDVICSTVNKSYIDYIKKEKVLLKNKNN